MKNQLLTLLILSGLLFSACKRSTDEEKDFIGPVDTTTPNNFEVFGDSLKCQFDLVNFQISKQFFLANFSHEVAWTLVMKGEKSGAIHSISGISDKLDSLNSRFQGEADSVHFFLTGEKCMVTLSIAGWSKIYKTSFSINETKKFDCIILDDFEKRHTDTGMVNNYPDPEDSLVLFEKRIQEVSFEGKFIAKLSGYDVNKNYWLSSLSSQNINFSSLLSGKNPSSTYLNFFGKGQENQHSVIEIQLVEDENGDGLFKNTDDEIWSKQVALNGDWQQFSIIYNSFTKSSSVGNGDLETSKLLKINFVLVCNPAGGYAESYLDFVNFTFGKPFSQR